MSLSPTAYTHFLTVWIMDAFERSEWYMDKSVHCKKVSRNKQLREKISNIFILNEWVEWFWNPQP